MVFLNIVIVKTAWKTVEVAWSRIFDGPCLEQFWTANVNW